MYNDKLSNYYDILYSQKEYDVECQIIKKYSDNKNNLLDVGCGTMTHSIILSNVFKSIVSVDLSQHMLNVGIDKLKKKNITNIQTYCEQLDNLNFKNKFDSVISMFNVVNHITELPKLIDFFNQVQKSLIINGTFIFDCWNGVACTINKPTELSTKTLFYDNYTVISTVNTKTDLFNSISIMDTNIKVYDENTIIDEFNYLLDQKLWSPNIISELLKMSGLYIFKIIPYFNDNTNPTDKDYRLTFICKKN
jgi:SAM-dependent methyltransferase